MVEGGQGFVGRFLERYPLRSASIVVLIFIAVCLLGAFYLGGSKSCSGIFPDKVNEWGDFLAGVFAPAAFFFLALSIKIQSRELNAAVGAQKDMKVEMALQVSQMKFAGMAPFFHDRVQEIYNKFRENEKRAVFDFERYIMIYDSQSALMDEVVSRLDKVVHDILLDSSKSCDQEYIDSVNKEINNLSEKLREFRDPVFCIRDNLLELGTYFNFYSALEKLYADSDGEGVIYKAFSKTLYSKFGEACRFILDKTVVVIQVSSDHQERLRRFQSICYKFYEKF